MVALATALLAAGSAGCEESSFFGVPQPEIQVDELSQRKAALVDILWVVDNSPSMVQEQQQLADNFDRFITGLTNCSGTGFEDDVCDFETQRCSASNEPCSPPDYHIGVISTDARSDTERGRLRRVGLCVPAPGSAPNAGKFRYCQSDDTQCAHDPTLASSDPGNSICDMGQATSFVTATTDNAADAFSRIVQVGTAGSGRETGFEAAALAVGRAPDPDATDGAADPWLPIPSDNSGFLRDDASLFLIFVSDEDDNSFGEAAYFYRAFETLRGAGNEGLVSVAAIVGDPDPDGTDEELGGCPVDATAAMRTAAPGGRYVALAMYSRGLSSALEVCDERRLGCREGTACTFPVPGLPGICLPTGDCEADQDCGGVQCPDGRGCLQCNGGSCEADELRFVDLLRQDGVFESICAPDYGEVLDALGFEAAGLARKFTLTRGPDCTERVPCCDAEVAVDDCGDEAPVCVRVDGSVVPNARRSGWVYDSASNAVFFDGDFVPPTAAEVTIEYKAPENISTAVNCVEVLD